MNNNKDVIEQFVDSCVVAKRDYPLLDILWTFWYSLPSPTAYHKPKHRKAFRELLYTICKRNLQKKHNLLDTQIKEKMNIFIDFLESMPDFLPYETYDEDTESLDKILMDRTSVMLAENTEQRIREVSPGLDTQILSFVLHYIPEKIQESLCGAEEHRAMDKSYSDKYEVPSDFHIKENRETGEISYFEIDTKAQTYLFNKMFDQELKKAQTLNKSALYSTSEYEDKCDFWQFGDELVKLGIGYWMFSLSSRHPEGHVQIGFRIPKVTYDVMQLYKERLPQIVDISAKVSQITKERVRKEEWPLGDLEGTEVVREVSEREIETSIASNPGILEDGLRVIRRQYPTSVGPIDILCKDKDENFVVVELKKGTGSFEVIGQIQKYIVWVDENLAKGNPVRGIIVAKTYNRQLEYAIKGSNFPIETKIFEDILPHNREYQIL